MFLRVNKCKKMNRIFVAFLAVFSLLVPISIMESSVAFAQDLTRTVDGTMNITMQEALSPSANSSNLATTGDPLFFVVLGLIALAIGVLYLALVTKKQAVCAHAQHARKANFSLDIKSIFVFAISIAIALSSFWTCLDKTSVHAKEEKVASSISEVVIDQDGNIIDGKITVKNLSEKSIQVRQVDSPESFVWSSSDILGKVIEAEGEMSGSWSGEAIPSEILQQVKDNGSLQINYQSKVVLVPTSYEMSDENGEATVVVNSATAGDWEDQALTVTVSFKDGTTYTPIPDSVVVIEEDGSIQVEPQDETVYDKEIRVNVKKYSNNEVVSERDVTLFLGAGSRGTKATDESGNADFEPLNVTFNTQKHGNDTFEKGINSSTGMVSAPTVDDYGTCAGLQLEGWYENEACTGTKVDLSTKIFSEATTLYANWVPDSTADGNLSYWIAPAMKTIVSSNSEPTSNVYDSDTNPNGTYVKEEWNVKKTSAEIKADVAEMKQELNDGKTTSTEGSKLKEYATLMKDDKYHLYTKWNGGNADKTGESALNNYVEARLINVGEHLNSSGSKDGSIITFSATHSLPAAYVMNDTAINYTGWANSALGKKMTAGGEIYNNFNTAFTSDICAIAKETGGTGSKGTTSTVKTTYDKLWVSSCKEYCGVSSGTSERADEGTQYAYWSSSYTGAYSTIENRPTCVAGITGSRRGSSPLGHTENDSCRPAWQRSPWVAKTDNYGYVCDGGYLGHSGFCQANEALGVIPCFAFGSTTSVNFNTQGHGNANFTLSTGADGKVTVTEGNYGTCAGLQLEGWYENEACTGTKVDLSTKIFSETTTLYANWVPDSTTDGNLSYWISPSYKITTGNTSDTANIDNTYDASTNPTGTYISEEWNVKKTSAEIKADVAEMNREIAEGKTVSTAGSKLKEYNDMMKADNYHLYTKWNGSTTDYSGTFEENGYVEFRILQVGSHGSNETLTFQASHLLNTALSINNGNTGGWASSNMRTQLKSGGSVWNSFNSAFTNDLLQVDKAATVGGGSTVLTSTADKMWVLSYSEITGRINDTQTIMEGDQYDFYRDKSIDTDTTFSNYSLTLSTRAGNEVLNQADHGRTAFYLRSPETVNKKYWAVVANRGRKGSSVGMGGNWPGGSEFGVVPCFCF